MKRFPLWPVIRPGVPSMFTAFNVAPLFGRVCLAKLRKHVVDPSRAVRLAALTNSRRGVLRMSARASISTALVLLGSQLSAQTPRDLVGAWEPVSIVNTSPDGTKTNQWGTPPKGSLLFTQDGRFNIILHRADLPKIVANSRAEGTPDENRAIVQGSIGFYGTYSMDGGTLIMKTEGGTYQNWAGTDQRSEISGFTSDQMTWTINSSRGGTNVANLRRVK